LASAGASLLPSVFMGTISRSHSVDYCTPRSKHASFIHTVWLTNAIQKPNKKQLYLNEVTKN